MEPAFFGDKSQSLFGVYHAPASQTAGDTAVLICYPFFQEYIRSHRAIVQLSKQLSKAGCHVFRFDYFATGDSAGELDDADLSMWMDNIKQAENELIELSGVRKISIIGLRMGALLAAQYQSKKVKDLILWDPVITGEQYIDDLKNMHQYMLVDSDRFAEPREFVKNDTATELLGFSVNNKLVDQIQSCVINENLNTKYEHVFLLTSEDQMSNNTLKENLTTAGLNVEYTCIAGEEGSGEWCELDKIEDMIMANKLLDKITELTV